MLENWFEPFTFKQEVNTYTRNKVIHFWSVSKATVKPFFAITEIYSLNKYVLAVSSESVLWENYERLRGPANCVLAVQNRHVLF